MAATFLLVLIVVALVFASAFWLPSRTSRKIARVMAGTAVAVQVVALIFVVLISSTQYSAPVVLWIGVGWIVFPVTLCGLALALELRDEPAVSPVLAISMLLFGFYVFFYSSGGQLLAASSLLLLIAPIYALGSQYPHRRSAEPAHG